MTTDTATPDQPEEQAAVAAEEQATDAAVATAERPAADAGNLTMADLLDQYVPSKALRRGEIIDGKIMSKTGEGLLVNIGYKSEGLVPGREMRTLGPDGVEELGVGDEIIAYVINPEGPDGSSILSIDRARGEQGWRILEKSMEIDETVKGKIIGSNRGGAVVEAEGAVAHRRFDEQNLFVVKLA